MVTTRAETEICLDVLIDNSIDVIVRFRLDGTIMSINDTVRKFVADPDQCIGKAPRDLECISSHAPQISKAFKLCCERLQPEVLEFDFARGELSGYSFQAYLIPIWKKEDGPSSLCGVYAIVRDVTQEKRWRTIQAERTKEQQILSQRIINKANKLENFAHIISHNLRSPVASLVGLIGLLDQVSSKDEQQQLLEMVKTSVYRLDETVNHLSEVIKINQSINIKLEEIDFEETLAHTLQSIVLFIEEVKADFTFDFRACKTFVYNKAYMQSIMLNLITNTLKYRHPDRAPRIELKTWKQDDKVLLSCRDNGQGIDLEKYGTKLFSLGKTFHGNQDARGEGLFITKNQIEALDGSITVESEVGKGTTFTIQFSQKKDSA
jgi:signal transduction histidine kinase